LRFEFLQFPLFPNETGPVNRYQTRPVRPDPSVLKTLHWHGQARASERASHPGGSADGDRSSPYVPVSAGAIKDGGRQCPCLPPNRSPRAGRCMQMPQPQGCLSSLSCAPIQMQADKRGKEEGGFGLVLPACRATFPTPAPAPAPRDERSIDHPCTLCPAPFLPSSAIGPSPASQQKQEAPCRAALPHQARKKKEPPRKCKQAKEEKILIAAASVGAG
jgi:hypothetical protein